MAEICAESMIENPVAITILNDFIFCPASIYFHALDHETEKIIYQDSPQLNGTAAHEKSDTGRYSTRRDILQGVSIFSVEYGLIGKIDTFDVSHGILTERKKKIVTIYDGYIYQIYGQYFALKEAGYTVKELRLYSMEDNKVFIIQKPEDNPVKMIAFKKIIDDVRNFSLEGFRQENRNKCDKCIYEPMCFYSALKI